MMENCGHLVFWTKLLRIPLQPRGNIPIAANITFLEDSLGHYNKTSNISISIIFEAPPTGQLKIHVMEKGGYLGYC